MASVLIVDKLASEEAGCVRLPECCQTRVPGRKLADGSHTRVSFCRLARPPASQPVVRLRPHDRRAKGATQVAEKRKPHVEGAVCADAGRCFEGSIV